MARKTTLLDATKQLLVQAEIEEDKLIEKVNDLTSELALAEEEKAQATRIASHLNQLVNGEETE